MRVRMWIMTRRARPLRERAVALVVEQVGQYSSHVYAHERWKRD